jgi:hypothetical protein
VHVLDEDSNAHRNCIVMAGAVARLQPPAMSMPPACAAGKVFQDLAGFAFRPFTGSGSKSPYPRPAGRRQSRALPSNRRR